MNQKIFNENKPIPFEILEKCSKKKNAICKIIDKGTGFLCKLNFKDINKSIIGLLTNHHVLNENEIQIGSKIEVEHEEKKKRLTLQ